MAVVFVVGLVFVVFDAYEVAVFGCRVEGEGDESVNSGGLGDDFEGPGLWRERVLEYRYEVGKAGVDCDKGAKKK